jgi:hypothetical protein
MLATRRMVRRQRFQLLTARSSRCAAWRCGV